MANRFSQLVRSFFSRPAIVEPDTGAGPTQNGFNPLASYYRSRMELSSQRVKKYKDYNDMGQDTFISGALNVYADEATQMDRSLGASVWAVTSNKKVDNEIRELFDRIDIEDHLFGIARYTAQYGDCFVRPLASKNEGIVSLEFMEAEDVERLVDVHGRLTGFRVPFMGDREFNPWDMIHFRIISLAHTIRHGGSLYGTSMLENTRRTWRTLTLLEDTLVIYRLEIGGRHRIFYIDVGGMSHEQALSTVRKYQRQFSKKEYYNADSGEWTSRFNPLNLTADIFWPIRKESQSRVDYLGTDPNINGIVDIEYFRNKLFASLRVPRAYLGGDEYSSVRFGLSQLDISFSRLIKRLQRAVINGLTDLVRIHLMLKDIDPRDEKNDFTLMMTSPSTLDQEQKLETLNLSLDIAIKLKQVGDMLNIDEQAMAAYIQRAIIGLTPYDLRQGGRVGTDDGGSIGFNDQPKDTRKELLDSMVANLTESSIHNYAGLHALPEVGSTMESIADEISRNRPIEASEVDPFTGELTTDEFEAIRDSLRNRK